MTAGVTIQCTVSIMRAATRDRDSAPITQPILGVPYPHTLQRKSHLFILRKGIARPHSSCVCARIIYSRDRPTQIFLQQNRNRNTVYKSLTDTWMWKLGLRPRNSFLGICVSNFRYCFLALQRYKVSEPIPLYPVVYGTDTVAKFIVHDWGDIVDSGIELSYRPASQCSLSGRYDNPMPESSLSPQRRGRWISGAACCYINGGSWNAFTIKRRITLLYISKQSTW